MVTLNEAMNLAVAHHQAGRLAEAERIYRAVLQVQPEQPDALHLLGVVARTVGQLDLAVELIGRAIAVRPDFPEAKYNLANALRALGRLEEAAERYRQAADLSPDYLDAHFHLGNTLWELKRRQAAADAFQCVMVLKPDHLDAIYNYAVAIQGLPGRHEEALATFRRCLDLKPDHAGAWNNIGNVLRELRRFDEALAAYHRSLALDPTIPETRKCLGLCLLLTGNLAEGFREYQARLKGPDGKTRDLPRPEWNGEPLAGKTILLHCEQGLGDTIQFIRYAPLVRRLGARVVLGSQAILERVLRTFDGCDALVSTGGVLPPFDLHAPLLSLPHLMGTTLGTVPAETPYLSAEPELVRSWAGRLESRERLRVGVVWAGNPGHTGDRARSLRLSAVLPLMTALPGVHFYGLQMGEGRRELAEHVLPLNFTDLGGAITDFADTAAIVATLDVVVSVDTSVAHLTGALGRPVWLLLSCVPDWRWMMNREDSPWYPTARLFRQTEHGDWAGVLTRIEGALGAML